MKVDIGVWIGRLFRRPFLNVILLSLGLAFGFVNVIAASLTEIPLAMGFDALEIHLAHGILFNSAMLVFGGLVGTAIIFAKRASGDGAMSLSLNAVALGIAAYFVLRSGMESGMIFYMGPAPEALAQHAAVESSMESAMTMQAIVNTALGVVLSLISTFASRDAQDEEAAK